MLFNFHLQLITIYTEFKQNKKTEDTPHKLEQSNFKHEVQMDRAVKIDDQK